MPTTNQTVPVDELIQTFIATNSSMLNGFVDLMKQIESDIVNAANGALQGETEELLRELAQIAGKSIEKILELQELLQTRFVESYFPAQD